MFSDEEWSKIVQRLLTLTRKGSAKWLDNGNYGYYFKVHDDVTYIISSQDRDGFAPYELKINQGTSQEYRTLGTLDTSGVTSSNDARAALFTLWEAAERSANNAPAIAAGLLEQLDSLDVEPGLAD